MDQQSPKIHGVNFIYKVSLKAHAVKYWTWYASKSYSYKSIYGKKVPRKTHIVAHQKTGKLYLKEKIR